MYFIDVMCVYATQVAIVLTELCMFQGKSD